MSDTVFGDLIHDYSRAQAIADGALIPAPDALAREAGIRWPVALTAAAWADTVAWSDADTDRKGVPQDETGRLWDVLWMLRYAISRQGRARRVAVELYRVPRKGKALRPALVRLVAVCGPGDDGEPVITVMQPEED